MVGRGQVDAELERETATECNKYGPVMKCVVDDRSKDSSIPDDDAVHIYVQFSYINAAQIGIYSYTHTLIQLYTHTLIQSYTHTLMHSYTHTFMHSYTHTLIHSYTHTLVPSYNRTLMHSTLIIRELFDRCYSYTNKHFLTQSIMF